MAMTLMVNTALLAMTLTADDDDDDAADGCYCDD